MISRPFVMTMFVKSFPIFARIKSPAAPVSIVATPDAVIAALFTIAAPLPTYKEPVDIENVAWSNEPEDTLNALVDTV
ncbi:MAG: hypothetical protein CVV47_10190 [Spirochaetae bacterium HGW-Spirochaetae-3]|nr:MAG: hypothetical protein CVV47_10190 [Spirochaetae bacterium HGW-Spirochaetae-3]